MGHGYKCGAGGGAPLNFKVVGNPQPSNPRENTIWVNTDVPISTWAFGDFPNPTWSMPEGWVYIHAVTSDAGRLDFNALKKNEIWIQPFYAKQYVNGAWVDKPLQIYQGGKWIDLIKFLYNYGDECADVTGGWVSVQPQSGFPMGNAVRGENYLLADSNWVENVGGTSVGWTHNNPVDLTNYKTLKFVITNAQSGNNRVSVYKGTSYVDTSVAYLHCPVVTQGELSIDVSGLSGEYKICFSAWSGNDMTIHKVWLE